MKDLAHHLFDILENSAKAGATAVSLRLETCGEALALHLEDNGPGFPPDLIADPANPYATTRTERPVGLGLALLRYAAQETGGDLKAGNAPAGGAFVQASFRLSHIDARPIGDLGSLILDACASWPTLRLTIELTMDDSPPEMVFDHQLVQDALDGLEVTHPSVRPLLKQGLRESLQQLYGWEEAIRTQALA